MIINKPSQNYISSPIPEENEINETSNLLNSENSATENQNQHTKVSKRIVFSWKQIKDSATEFLNSNNEIYLNVTNTTQNLDINDEVLYASQHMLSKNSYNYSADHQNNHKTKPVFQSPNSFMGIGEENQSLSFKNMPNESGFLKGNCI